tara:strand:- start:206 stop:790 length:585 start_codon:yes stop_codon:yes gene_type:complete
VIHHIFSNQFYSLITPPNKEDILSALKNFKVDSQETKNIKWSEKLPNIKVESLYPDEVLPFLIPSLKIFFEQLRVPEIPIRLLTIWKNTYRKEGYQEVHSHLSLNGDVHLSGCIFLDDFHPQDGKFYFYNRHACEISSPWRKILNENATEYVVYVPTPKRGDIIFFPADMLHGVYAHKSGKIRQTISFNIGMNL